MSSEQYKDRWLTRGHKFFRSLARYGQIRGALLRRGLSKEELQHGWQLFAAALGSSRSGKGTESGTLDAVTALRRIAAWDGPNYFAAQATLEHRTAAACSYLMNGLVAANGPESVIGVQQFVQRVDALREGTAEGVSATEGSEAVRLLAERRIFDESSEAELKTWIELAQEGAAPEPGDDKAEASFSAFRNWLNEWREVARVTITQRSHLISLGLAARRQSEEEEVQDVPVVEAAPVSVH
jgi:hypothetical protein